VELLDVEALDQLPGDRPGGAAAMAAQARHQHQVLPRREVLVERRELSRQRDHPPHPLGFADDVVPRDPGAAAIGAQQRREHSHHRRLPRAVRAEQRDDRPGLHV
jgi:hypothetical protein